MEYMNLSIEELHLLIKEKKVKPSDLAKEALRKAKELQVPYNSFVTILEEAVEVATQLDDIEPTNPLFGIPYAAKDNYSTKGILSTGSSNILKDYVPVYDATVITKLKEQNSVLIGKTVLDELAMGGTGMNGHTGKCINPWSKDLNRMSGGSSGGSAVAVAAGIVPFALGSDTGDSVRKPAAYCGIVGFKPTWGRISRYGVFPFCPSLDHVAYFTRTVKDSAYLLDVLAGFDKNDSTSARLETINYSKNINTDIKGYKIACIKEIEESIYDDVVKANIVEVKNKLRELGAVVEDVHIDLALLRAIYPVYMVLSCAEATSNNANLDGIKFGPRAEGKDIDEVVINSRTQGFSELVKRRFVIGSYCLAKQNKEKLFVRAQKIRRLIVDALNKIYENYDIILCPAAGDIAPKFEGRKTEKLSNEYLIAENHLGLGNFAGLPSITIPSGFHKEMPIGVNFMGKAFHELDVFNVASALEEVLPCKNQVAKVGGK